MDVLIYVIDRYNLTSLELNLQQNLLAYDLHSI
jgi:hypothetical protein